MSNPNKFYLTTPIYYVNGRPHIGHAYTTLVADVLARRHRLLGDETFFLTGTDEHGQKVERSAAAAGIPPQQFADETSAKFRALWDRMGLTYDRYIRTTDDKHKRGVQKLFRELYDRGHIYLSTYTGAYCITDEAFVDAPAGTPCPDCGRTLETVTEENFFFHLSAFQRPLLDLIESNTLLITPEGSRNEVLSFLRGNVTAVADILQGAKASPSTDIVILSEAKDLLSTGDGSTTNKDSVNATTDAVISTEGARLRRSGETPVFADASAEGASTSQAPTEGTAGFSPLNAATTNGASAPDIAYSAQGTPYVPGALKDLSVSRSSFTWGIPVPEDVQQAAGATQKHVVYVWLDALANYMTAIGYGSDDPAEQAEFQKFWPADLHLVGKEITRFHCIYWPAFLLALNPATTETSQSQDAVILTLSEAMGKNPRIPSVAATLPLEAHQAWAAKWLPKQITANGWLLFDNAKMSKSRGNVVRTETILDAFGTLCPPIHLGSTNKQSDGITESDSSQKNSLAESARLRKGTASAVPQDTEKNAALATEVRPPTPHERDLFAADVLRYFLLREIPFGQDGSFSFDAMVTRYNADLTNGFGNLVSRTLTLATAQFSPNTKLPSEPWLCEEWQPNPQKKGLTSVSEATSGTGTLIATIGLLADIDFGFYAQKNEFHSALTYVFNAISAVDNYLSWHKPWVLAKNSESTPNEAKLIEILYTAAECIRIITALLYPILPFATARVWAQLGLCDIEQAARNGDLKNLQWGGLKPGTKLGPLAPIFPRADKGLAQIMIDMENENTATTPGGPSFAPSAKGGVSSEARPTAEQPITVRPAEPLKSAATPAPVAPTLHSSTDPAAPPRCFAEPSGTLPVAGSSAITTEREHTPHTEAHPSGIFANETPKQPTDASPQITIDDFAKIELRVAQIIVAERIPKADKLLRLEVDLGYEKRQILSGIAEWYTPEDLLGRRIVVITNLAPRKMRGLESHGMLLAASEGEGGKPVLATFGEDIALGSRLK